MRFTLWITSLPPSYFSSLFDIKRVLRYVMLLKEVCRYTPSSHKDSGPLQQAFLQVQRLAVEINESQRKFVNFIFHLVVRIVSSSPKLTLFIFFIFYFIFFTFFFSFFFFLFSFFFFLFSFSLPYRAERQNRLMAIQTRLGGDSTWLVAPHRVFLKEVFIFLPFSPFLSSNLLFSS